MGFGGNGKRNTVTFAYYVFFLSVIVNCETLKGDLIDSKEVSVHRVNSDPEADETVVK